MRGGAGALPAPRLALGVVLLLAVLPSRAAGVNVTAALAAFPSFGDFARLLASSPVAGELATRSSLTLLAVPNNNLPRSPSAFAAASGADIADVLRYHVLLEYLSPSDLARLPSSGKLVTTLYQTTGRAPSDLGSVNLTIGGNSTVVVRSPAHFPASSATVLGAVTSVPYNLSVLAVGSLVIPSGFDIAASDSHSTGVNITRVLADARGFNVAASMLEASGVAAEFGADERGAGITVFVPIDDAFAGLPATDRLQSLPADSKAVVLRYHVLHSYYPLGSLESIVNPVQPTLATEGFEAGQYTLNITRVNGSVAIDTGVVQASITRTVFDQNPVAVFAVSKVLLPKELFGGHSAAMAPMPDAMGPDVAENMRTPPTRLSSPPALRGGADSKSSSASAMSRAVNWWCIWLVLLELHLLLLHLPYAHANSVQMLCNVGFPYRVPCTHHLTCVMLFLTFRGVSCSQWAGGFFGRDH
uniref:FAS1 domain-containing protein n=1 Tax=Leersia perrieri TaxID=77586 RepID=A0A0D9V7M6_9ORYZ